MSDCRLSSRWQKQRRHRPIDAQIDCKQHHQPCQCSSGEFFDAYIICVHIHHCCYQVDSLPARRPIYRITNANFCNYHILFLSFSHLLLWDFRQTLCLRAYTGRSSSTCRRSLPTYRYQTLLDVLPRCFRWRLFSRSFQL